MPDFATLIARPSPAPGAPEPTAGRWLAGVRRGLDLLVAFATLRDAEAAADARAGRGRGRRGERRAGPDRAERAEVSPAGAGGADAASPRGPLASPAAARWAARTP